MNDEAMHPVGDDDHWSESYYFNFVDPDTRWGMFTRMGFRPGNGWADALHVVYLDGHRVAFTYGRRDIEPDLSRYDDDLAAGHLRLTCIAPHRRWRIRYAGPAQDIADAEILLTRSRERPASWFTAATLEMDLSFDCLTEPHYAARGNHGHFEQAGRVSGEISLTGAGVEAVTGRVAGFGVRDKSWGPRDWGAGNQASAADSGPSTALDPAQPAPFVNWFSMNFGAHAALGGSCFRQRDGTLRGSGWLQRDATTEALEDVVMETRYRPDSIVHTDVKLSAVTGSGEPLAIDGRVLSVCPTKIPMPGGATFVNEGLAEFSWNGQTGYGIAEHWHAVRLGA